MDKMMGLYFMPIPISMTPNTVIYFLIKCCKKNIQIAAVMVKLIMATKEGVGAEGDTMAWARNWEAKRQRAVKSANWISPCLKKPKLPE